MYCRGGHCQPIRQVNINSEGGLTRQRCPAECPVCMTHASVAPPRKVGPCRHLDDGWGGAPAEAAVSDLDPVAVQAAGGVRLDLERHTCRHTVTAYRHSTPTAHPQHSCRTAIIAHIAIVHACMRGPGTAHEPRCMGRTAGTQSHHTGTAHPQHSYSTVYSPQSTVHSHNPQSQHSQRSQSTPPPTWNSPTALSVPSASTVTVHVSNRPASPALAAAGSTPAQFGRSGSTMQ